jgi:hypothetical protein
MDEAILIKVLDRLHEVNRALAELETRIDDSVEGDDARRALLRAQSSLESALKLIDPNLMS